ncbi:MAG: homoserine kinase [Chloroflexota bacterium]
MVTSKKDTVKVFAPATIANLGPGFDILGLAVDGLGDSVTARRIPEPEVIIETITGDNNRLPRIARKNTAGVAALEALKIVGATSGVALSLDKGLPSGSGLGSSAASAAAAAWAVACLNEFTDKEALLPACLAAEELVSGYHADNVAPALMGGLVFIKGYEPLRLESLPVPKDLVIILATPNSELPTAEARQVVPTQVDFKVALRNMAHFGALLTACFRQDAISFGRAVADEIVEPARAHLVPAFYDVKQAAIEAGGLGCSISGAGPTIFAIAESQQVGELVGEAMKAAFAETNVASVVRVTSVDVTGAKEVL